MKNATETQGLSHGRSATQKQRWIEGCIIVAFWGVIALLDIAEDALDPRGDNSGLRTGEALHTFLEYVVWAILTPGIFWLSRRFSLEHRDWLRHLLLHVFVAVMVAAGIDLIKGTLWDALVTGNARPIIPAQTYTRVLFQRSFLPLWMPV